MSSAVLHIKDSYFFEVPKMLWRSARTERRGADGFPDFWVALDEDYLLWEAPRFVSALQAEGIQLPQEFSVDRYRDWLHAGHANAGKPFQSYVAQSSWFVEKLNELAAAKATIKDRDASPDATSAARVKVEELNQWLTNWQQAQSEARDVALYDQQAAPWSQAKIDGYNRALDGKILIPQPFGELRNLHEAGSTLIPSSVDPQQPVYDRGLCISRYMVVQLAVVLIMAWLFIRLANRMSKSNRPQGRVWNALEAVLTFLRDEIARPAIGKKEGDRYVPLLWSVFWFVLLMNLMGMVPWVGAPTSAFAVTAGLAAVTLLTGIIMGSIKFGPIGFWTNQIPGMDLHWAIGLVIKPMLWAIEVLGLFIKHGVLAVRLLANMVAGHIVLLGIMGIAFSLEAAAGDFWWLAAPISVIGSTLFSVLELLVAFLQAYIFTFLSALFIGAAVHHH